jgi:hypothetical protein
MAKARGVYKGGKKRLDSKRIAALRAEGIGATEIATWTGVSRARGGAVLRVLAGGPRFVGSPAEVDRPVRRPR